ncbi:MAG TPA: hypothetical protein VNJ46_08355 [Gaiellaceae bacterium]|nr:hypothetical protein [Gaiellaceae bacterium]
MKTLLALAAATALAALAAAAARADGAPSSPGLLQGGEGVQSPSGVRYVTTTVGADASAVLAVRGRSLLRARMLPGLYGIPLVAYDGTAGGLSGDGRRLTVASDGPPPGAAGSTRFLVLDAETLIPRSRVELSGSWSYDASSPDGKTLFLVEHLSVGANPRYRVRVFDLRSGRLRPGAVVDRIEREAVMGGQPVTRAASGDGRWAYTLYAREGDSPFVHALDTARAEAYCIDLPLRLARDAQWRLRLALAGATLAVRDGRRTRALIDLRTFAVRKG